MKKSTFFVLALIGLLSHVAAMGNENHNPDFPGVKELVIEMDSEGQVSNISWNNREIYQSPPSPSPSSPKTIPLVPFMVRLLPGGRAFPKVLDVGTHVTIMINGFDNDKYKIAITPQKSKYELVPIYTGETKAYQPKEKPKPLKHTRTFLLDESGTVYQIKIFSNGSSDPIFVVNLQTRARYYLGSHVGIFCPFGKPAEYDLGYASSSDVNTTIMENKLRNATLVFVGTVYPFGFEPEGKAFSYRRIQLNLATELSSSIFKKIYFGPGYDFTFFSIGVLFRYGETQELRSGFKVGDQVSSSIKTVPTVSKNKLDWGITVCLPLNLMINWLGRSLGIR